MSLDIYRKGVDCINDILEKHGEEDTIKLKQQKTGITKNCKITKAALISVTGSPIIIDRMDTPAMGWSPLVIRESGIDQRLRNVRYLVSVFNERGERFNFYTFKGNKGYVHMSQRTENEDYRGRKMSEDDLGDLVRLLHYSKPRVSKE